MTATSTGKAKRRSRVPLLRLSAGPKRNSRSRTVSNFLSNRMLVVLRLSRHRRRCRGSALVETIDAVLALRSRQQRRTSWDLSGASSIASNRDTIQKPWVRTKTVQQHSQTLPMECITSWTRTKERYLKSSAAVAKLIVLFSASTALRLMTIRRIGKSSSTAQTVAWTSLTQASPMISSKY